MPLALPFPNIDPILIQLGPFAIRWYALAYIVGILAGWFYARAIIRSTLLFTTPSSVTRPWATMMWIGGFTIEP